MKMRILTLRRKKFKHYIFQGQQQRNTFSAQFQFFFLLLFSLRVCLFSFHWQKIKMKINKYNSSDVFRKKNNNNNFQAQTIYYFQIIQSCNELIESSSRSHKFQLIDWFLMSKLFFFFIIDWFFPQKLNQSINQLIDYTTLYI